MAQDLAFSGTPIRAGVGSVLGAVSIALAGCGPQGGEPPQALSNVQRQLCVQEGIDSANQIMAARNAQSGKGWINKVYTPKDAPTDQDVFMAERRRAEALCLQETRAGLRKDAEDKGTSYPAFGTAGQKAEPVAAAPAPAEAASAPVPAPAAPAPAPAASAPEMIPPAQSIDPTKERLDPPSPAASAPVPSAGASAPEGAASAAGGRTAMDYILNGARGKASEGQSR